jgi:hypothetical protein
MKEDISDMQLKFMKIINNIENYLGSSFIPQTKLPIKGTDTQSMTSPLMWMMQLTFWIIYMKSWSFVAYT